MQHGGRGQPRRARRVGTAVIVVVAAALALAGALARGGGAHSTARAAASLPGPAVGTGSSLASVPATGRSVGTVYPPSTRFSPQGPYLAGSVLIGFHSGVSAAQRNAIEHAAGALSATR